MRFTPKSKEELDARDLMPKGEYDAEILESEETVSKTSGKPMFKLKLGVYDAGGRQQWVYDYIVCDTYKLPNIARACRLFSRYESGELTADELRGRDVKVRVAIDPAKDGHAAKNKIADYLFEEETPPAGGPKTPKDPDPLGEDEDSIPFNGEALDPR